MKAFAAAVLLASFVVACRPEATRPKADESPAPTEASRAESRRPASGREGGDPCTPLAARMVRHDTAGTPFAFSFEIPDGFEVKGFSGGETVGADVTLDLDGKRGDEYVLRIAYSTKVLENPPGLVDVWRKLQVTEKVLEKVVDGRTMYLQRVNLAGMTGFNVLFPAFESASGAHLVVGGVTSAPKPCRDEAAETVEKMLMSFERNPRVGPVPAP